MLVNRPLWDDYFTSSEKWTTKSVSRMKEPVARLAKAASAGHGSLTAQLKKENGGTR